MTPPPEKTAPRRRWPRLLLYALAGLVALAGLAWLLVPRLLEPMVQRKLQGMVSSRLDARLEIGSLAYLPPLGVRVTGAKLVADDPGQGGKPVELVKFARLDLKLAKPPFGEGPLVIRNVYLKDLDVHLIRTAHGRIVGAHDFVRQQPAPLEPQKPGPPPKLSDMFELRRFVVDGGQVVYEDRTRPDAVPVAWKDFRVDLDTAPSSKSLYDYKFSSSGGGVAELSSEGSFDIDALRLDARRLALAVHVNPASPTSALPPGVQSVLRENRVRGNFAVDASGTLPFRDAKAATFGASVVLDGASAFSPEWGEALDKLDLKLRATRGPPPGGDPQARVSSFTLDSFEAVSGQGALRVEEAALHVDHAAGTWALPGIAGVVRLGPNRPAAAPAPSAVPAPESPDEQDEREAADAPDAALRIAIAPPAGEVRFSAEASGPLRPPEGTPLRQVVRYHALLRPSGVRFQPPKFPLPLENLGGGTVELRPGLVEFQNLTATYGPDEIHLTRARLPLPQDVRDLRDGWALEEISGNVTFHQPGPPYPAGLGKTLRRLRPEGLFYIGGGSRYALRKVELDPADLAAARPRTRLAPATGPVVKKRSDYFFGISTDDGTFRLLEGRLPLTRLKGDATVSNLLIDLPRLEGRLLGGRVTASGKITNSRPWAFEGRVAGREIDLREVARAFPMSEKAESRLSGRGFVNVDVSGTMTPDDNGDGDAFTADGPRPVDTFRAAGEFEVLEGDFWTIPVLGGVAKNVKTRGDLTVGEAAGLFDVRDRVLVLRKAAVASPALGLEGEGAIDLIDGALELRITAAPLGDWRERMRRAKVPIVSDVAAEIAGGVQALLGGATRALLYEVHVTGTAKDPEIETVPAPGITEPAALLFGKMLKGEKNARLIEALRERKEIDAPGAGLGKE